MKACIILPTYNEKENIGDLLNALLKEFGHIKDFDMCVLVVDDNSPDGTSEIVKEYTKKHSNIFLLKRDKKEGLGAAYVAGFEYAIDKLGADIVFEMDADSSHAPKHIPKFLEEIDNGSDFVIGSRYIDGGGTPDWTFKRRAISYGGNLIGRIIAGMKGVRDCTSGYRAIKTSLLRKIDFNSINEKGYAFQLSLLHAALNRGAKLREIPIVFHDRRRGASKLEISDLLEFIKTAIRLRLKGY
ncbi:MAG: polyprenol monophosphomannose synthase [Methanocellales archaeon]|nr:polyprenol monophosphomannose synthase [Methanocellales archaeon]